jgi:hypothetical protein
MRKVIRYGKLLAAAGVASAAAAAVLIPAGSGAFLGGEKFHGTVNGATSGAAVTVICPGVATTGSVKTGQDWGVISDAAGPGVIGTTGTKTVVASFAGVVGGPSTTFTAFGTQPIPTSPGGVPCTGPGSVTFATNGNVHTSTSVSVTFVKVAS